MPSFKGPPGIFFMSYYAGMCPFVSLRFLALLREAGNDRGEDGDQPHAGHGVVHAGQLRKVNHLDAVDRLGNVPDAVAEDALRQFCASAPLQLTYLFSGAKRSSNVTTLCIISECRFDTSPYGVINVGKMALFVLVTTCKS